MACRVKVGVSLVTSRPPFVKNQQDIHRSPPILDKVAYFDRMAERWDDWKARNPYYYAQMRRLLQVLVPPGSRVLEVGCATGDELASVRPGEGVGIDFSPRMVELARRKHPHLRFEVMPAEELRLTACFDYILACNLVGDLEDVQAAFQSLHRVSHPGTRVILIYYNYLWEPFLKLAEWLGLKRPTSFQNWLPLPDLFHILTLTGFEAITWDCRLLLPIYIPIVSTLCNRFLAKLPGIRRLGLMTCVVARPRPQPVPHDTYSVTVVIPCWNERGTVGEVIRRMPLLGRHTEVIFVDGNSTDGTVEEIESIIQAYPDRAIKLIHQGCGVGKGDAVRRGFAAATGDVLMILDADLSVAPEDLPRFYRALIEGHGELINGSRMVYQMERQAMRLLNLVGNYLFGWAFTWLLGQRFRDTLCGTKAIRRADYERLAAARPYFGDFDPFGDFDLILGAAKLNLKVCEVPVRYRARVYGKTKISRFRHGLLLLRMTWLAARKFRFIDSSGHR
jgi:SAM-dependent methyltransferase